MKSFVPYISFNPIGGSNAFELSVLIQVPAGHNLQKIEPYMEGVNGELADIVDFYFEPSVGAPATTIDRDFTMSRDHGQTLIIVRVWFADGTRPNPQGSSSGHYGDPK